MGRNNYFQFKKFRIEQEQSAMKVGVDGILLGAWVNVKSCRQILDVGTGTGLIALMLAQRSAAEITAIEIEEKAAVEAAANVAASPWKNRVEVQHISFQDFAAKTTLKFDLIVSNPPYFSNSFKASSNERSLARHNDKLTITELVQKGELLLTEKGRLAVILPVEPAMKLIDLAESNGLNLTRLTKVSPNSQKEPHRYLMELSTEKLPCRTGSLAIRNYHQEDYSAAYKLLCKEFYLLF